MTRYIFEVVIELGDDAWYAHAPVLVQQGGAAGSASREEALANSRGIRMVVASAIEHASRCRKEAADCPRSEKRLVAFSL